MGESFLHIDVSIDARVILVAHHANRPDACVGCNNFVYYEEGNPSAVVVPDVFVVFGVPKRTDRRDGGLCRFSEVLGLDLRLEDGRLRFFDPERGEYLLAPEEQQQALKEQDVALKEQEVALKERDLTVDQQRQALEAAEARIRELERQRHPEG